MLIYIRDVTGILIITISLISSVNKKKNGIEKVSQWEWNKDIFTRPGWSFNNNKMQTRWNLQINTVYQRLKELDEFYLHFNI